jgi:hypothetical protein
MDQDTVFEGVVGKKPLDRVVSNQDQNDGAIREGLIDGWPAPGPASDLETARCEVMAEMSSYTAAPYDSIRSGR